MSLFLGPVETKERVAAAGKGWFYLDDSTDDSDNGKDLETDGPIMAVLGDVNMTRSQSRKVHELLCTSKNMAIKSQDSQNTAGRDGRSGETKVNEKHSDILPIGNGEDGLVSLVPCEYPSLQRDSSTRTLYKRQDLPNFTPPMISLSSAVTYHEDVQGGLKSIIHVMLDEKFTEEFLYRTKLLYFSNVALTGRDLNHIFDLVNPTTHCVLSARDWGECAEQLEVEFSKRTWASKWLQKHVCI